MKIICKCLDYAKPFYINIYIGKKILTMWEITSHTYKKRKEIFIYDSIQANIQFSKNGAYFMLNSSDSKTIYIYDAHNLTEVSKVTLTAKDSYGNEISYFYIFNLSFDGSYILASDYSNWYIFTNKGEYVKTIQTRGQTSIYHYSKNEFLILQFPEYTNTNIVAVDFLKDTERILYKGTGYMYMFYLSDDWSYFVLSNYSNYYYGSFKTNEELKPFFETGIYVTKIAFKGSKIGVLYSFNSEYFVAVYQNGKLLRKDNFKIKGTYADFHGFDFTKDKEDNLLVIENSGGIINFSKVTSTSSHSISLKTIKNISFQYPYIVYIRGTKEVWVQDLENKIKIFYLDSSIIWVENLNMSDSYDTSNVNLGMLLDCEHYFKVGM